MFYAARVGKNLHVTVRTLPFVAACAMVFACLIAGAWWGCLAMFRWEMYGLRMQLRTAVAGAMSDTLEEVMLRSTGTMAQLQGCENQMAMQQQVNTDLVKAMEKAASTAAPAKPRPVAARATPGGIGGE